MTTIISRCCGAPVHSQDHHLFCSSCKTIVDARGRRRHGLFDHIINLLDYQSDEVVEECVKTGYFYQPFVPLQVTPLELKEDE